ncbi:hypothetical protein [Thalassobacillus devorans]|uniref:hypothetical protein n=1 Tax=Thalassobacillus devorans TaxID=279813 RepID=UPI000491F04D|nr:hypothetical protein [Thalassobacillus devorans]
MRYLKEEELEVTSRYLFLSMALVVIQQDRRHIEKGQFKIKEHYLELLGKMEYEARTERRELRARMDREKLQVVQISKNDSFTSFLFLAHGYEEKRNYFNPAIRKKVENILYELMQKALRSAPQYTQKNA